MDQQLILERYRPLEELGRGGFGTVTLAWDTRMQRRVAIKRLPLPMSKHGTPEKPAGLDEARIAAMLHHPAIVTVFDFDTDDDETFIIMEYVDGASLATLLEARKNGLGLDETAAIVDAVASALDFGHDNGVLHLDIKPGNILVGRDGRVKVADFGMSELSTLSGHRPAWGGTAGYMPFEQVEGEQVTERTDEWALAVVTFECLTGVNPFLDGSPSAATREFFDPPLPSLYNQALSDSLDDVIATGSAARPADRYETAAVFAEEILPLLGDPELGRELLGELVAEVAGEEAEESYVRVGLWDRMQGRVGTVVIRAAAALEAGWLTWTGLRPWALDPLPLAAAVALVVLASAFSPSLGIGLGLITFAIGLAASGSWVATVVAFIGLALWWWFAARRHPGAAVLPLAGPVFATFKSAPLLPLLAGFTLTPINAAASALVGGVFTMVASAASSQTVPYLDVWLPYVADVWGGRLSSAGILDLLGQPAALIALASWPVAAAVVSLASGRATRGGALLGMIAGSAILAGGYVLADLAAGIEPVTNGWSSPGAAIALGISFILALVVVALGAPVRGEDD